MDGFNQAGHWRGLHEEFMGLASEEEGIVRATRKDRFLRAYCEYKEHPEVLERGKPEQGWFCLLKAPETGLWTLSDGVSENFQERFRALAARAGCALGSPIGVDAEDFWLHRLYCDLLDNRSDQLFAASKEGGVILRVCVASATFCSRLERKAFEQSEPGSTRAALRGLRDIRITERREHNLRAWLVEHGIAPGPDVLASFAENSEKTTQSVESKAASRRLERADAEVAKRAVLARANRNTPAGEMCEIFDHSNVRLPAKWLDAGFRTWIEAYRNSGYRSRIHTLISKDRRKN